MSSRCRHRGVCYAQLPSAAAGGRLARRPASSRKCGGPRQLRASRNNIRARVRPVCLPARASRGSADLVNCCFAVAPGGAAFCAGH
eukprot:10574098-Alexandrium_andersonii.AAC.1